MMQISNFKMEYKMERRKNIMRTVNYKVSLITKMEYLTNVNISYYQNGLIHKNQLLQMAS